MSCRISFPMEVSWCGASLYPVPGYLAIQDRAIQSILLQKNALVAVAGYVTVVTFVTFGEEESSQEKWKLIKSFPTTIFWRSK